MSGPKNSTNTITRPHTSLWPPFTRRSGRVRSKRPIASSANSRTMSGMRSGRSSPRVTIGRRIRALNASVYSDRSLDPGRAHPSGADHSVAAHDARMTKEARPVSSQPPLIDPAQARATLRVGDRDYAYHRLDAAGATDLARLPYTVKVLLENALRHAAGSSGLV